MNINIVRLFSTFSIILLLENYATKTALTPFLHRRNLGVRKSFRWTKREREGKKQGENFITNLPNHHHPFSSEYFPPVESWNRGYPSPPLDVDKLATGIPCAPFRPNKIKSLGRGGGGGGGEIFNENSRVLCSVGNAFQRGRFQGVNYKLRPLIRQRYGRVYLSFRLGGTNLVARNGWRNVGAKGIDVSFRGSFGSLWTFSGKRKGFFARFRRFSSSSLEFQLFFYFLNLRFWEDSSSSSIR